MEKKSFSKLTAAQKRVSVAKDVLIQLKCKRLEATQGVYVDYEDIGEHGVQEKLSEVIKNKKCQACAIGGLFICAVDKFDKLKVGDLCGVYVISKEDIVSYLSKFFSMTQLNLMEAVFEEYESVGYECRYKSFWKSTHNATERMAKIMRNIVRNNGTFILPK